MTWISFESKKLYEFYKLIYGIRLACHGSGIIKTLIKTFKSI